MNRWDSDRRWNRIGLILGFDYAYGGLVLVFWGTDFPCEEEYREQLVVL
jgi:hypothetical protein